MHQKEDTDRLPNERETVLLKERLQLMKRNEHLQRKLKEKEDQLKKYSEEQGSRIETYENIIEKDNLVLSKSEE